MNGMQKVPTSWKTGLQRMAPGVYAYIQAGGLNVSNAGLVVGDDEALVVDALYVRPMTQAFQECDPKGDPKAGAQDSLHPPPCGSHTGAYMV